MSDSHYSPAGPALVGVQLRHSQEFRGADHSPPCTGLAAATVQVPQMLPVAAGAGAVVGAVWAPLNGHLALVPCLLP